MKPFKEGTLFTVRHVKRGVLKLDKHVENLCFSPKLRSFSGVQLSDNIYLVETLHNHLAKVLAS